uniref:sigma 54-interacting transcriptional regulator n=1 Tax=Ningiella ruwaisensis TaxID=2364274 RepID=UPI00109FBFE2|nr:sigma 54-interacting transcriptional regulator [Ningiella ruwaisensis]
MKLSDSARAQLLTSLRLMTQSVYVQIVDKIKGNQTRFQSGELNSQLQLHLQAPSQEFISAIEMRYGNFEFTFSAFSSSHFSIHLKDTGDLDAGRSDDDQRKRVIIHDEKQRILAFDLLSDSAFPDWLTSLIQTEYSESHSRPQRLFLNHCISIFNSFKIFDQLRLLTVDSLTKLQSRSALQSAIDENVSISGVILCMFHCRDFQIVNRKFGQAKGDQVLNEIAGIINQYTRAGDLACRFGGALFGIASQANSVDDGLKLAQKLQNELHNRPYLKNAIRLSFNVGVAFVEKDENLDEDSTASSILINRAEQALKAAQTSDKPSIVHWEADKFKYDEQEFNYIGGIFTPDNVTNYRNMLLLWDISSIIADEYEFSRLLRNVVERLAYTFEFQQAGIVSLDTDINVEHAYTVTDLADVSEIKFNDLDKKHAIKEAAEQAIDIGQHAEIQIDNQQLLVVPLGSEINACLFIMGQKTAFDLTHDSVMLFAGFARQIGKALKRSQLEDELNRNLEAQNAQLERELQVLKTGLQSSALVYRSKTMQAIVDKTQRAAQTDTTILVTGESGTGKEKLIHAIHNLSPRSKKPLIIVDCGSIPETLIESELFGYVKGAFTGAQSQSIGKIQAADGGILVLDEIGELPLSMQPKLLRFVQEKHFTPVGGNKSIDVDVKIVAVTNRDLALEVQKGKFRQDLYYRLNVVTIHNPPLRERLDDIALLSQHFLTKFANQFSTTRKLISNDTILQMQAYSWPGNIRELENKLMQASLMCQGEEIVFSDLNIVKTNDPSLPKVSQTAQSHATTIYLNGQQTGTEDAIDISFDDSGAVSQSPEMADHFEQGEVYESLATESANAASTVLNGTISEDDWHIDIHRVLGRLIDEVMRSSTFYEADIGNWIEHQLFNQTAKHCSTNKAIANRLQIPVSTARRRAIKAQTFTPEAVPTTFQELSSLLEFVASGKVKIGNPLDTLKRSLLRTILEKQPASMTYAANLLGVSEPTLYKLKRDL